MRLGSYHDAIHVINLQSGRVIEKLRDRTPSLPDPFHPDGKSYFVSSWADGSVYHHNANNGETAWMSFDSGQHPTDMVWRARKPDEKRGGAGMDGPLVRCRRRTPTTSTSSAFPRAKI